MENSLRDPIWQFLGVVVSSLAIVVSVYLFLSARKRKSLSYIVLSQMNLLPMNEQADEFQITFRGTAVYNVQLLLLQIINDGNIPIASSDFETPLTFSMGADDCKVLSVEITKTEPKHLSPMINVQTNCIILQPLLINGGDSILLKMLIEGFNGFVLPKARIIGVKTVKELKEPVYKLWMQGLFITLLGLIVLAPTFLVLLRASSGGNAQTDVSIMFLYIGAIILWVGLGILVTALVRVWWRKLLERRFSK